MQHAGYSLYTLPWLVFVAEVAYFYICGRIRATKQSGEPLISWREAAMAAWVAYIGFILTLALFMVQRKVPFLQMPAFAWERLHTRAGINFVPFHEISLFFRAPKDWRFLVNIVGNICVFIPIGGGLPLFWKRFQSIGKMIGVCLAFPVFIEFIQLFVGRYVDIDDVILNFSGMFLGYVAFRIVTRYWPWPRTLAR